MSCGQKRNTKKQKMHILGSHLKTFWVKISGNKAQVLYFRVLWWLAQSRTQLKWLSSSWWLSSKESTWQCRTLGFESWRRKWQPTPVFLPGKSHGQRSLAGSNPWGRKKVQHDLATKQQQSYWIIFHCLSNSNTLVKLHNLMDRQLAEWWPN